MQTESPFTYRLFRHSFAPKDPQRQQDHMYDFQRPLDGTGISQAIALGERLVKQGLEPRLVLYSQSPRSFHTARYACNSYLIPAASPLQNFWPTGDRQFFSKFWEITSRNQSNLEAYLNNPEDFQVCSVYAGRIETEIRRILMEQPKIDSGEIWIFGHGVWNCFVAWCLAGCPKTKEPFFVHLDECDELTVKGDTVEHVPFNKAAS